MEKLVYFIIRKCVFNGVVFINISEFFLGRVEGKLYLNFVYLEIFSDILYYRYGFCSYLRLCIIDGYIYSLLKIFLMYFFII